MKQEFQHPLSNSKSHLHLFLLTVFLLWMQTAGAEADTKLLACPSVSEERSELTGRMEKLVRVKLGLETFLAGKKVTEIPLTALFMIDLTDTDAVARRAMELQQEINAVKNQNTSQDPYLDCALSIHELRTLATQVIDLQKAVSTLRWQFLALPPEKRAAILQPQIEATVQADSVIQLQQERRSALEEQKEAVHSLAKAEEQVLLANKNGNNGDLTSERAELEKTRAELTALQVKWVTSLEQEASYYHETTEKLAEIGRSLLQPGTIDSLKTDYQKSVAIWRILVDNTHKTVSGRNALILPTLPEYPKNRLTEIGNTEEARHYSAAYADTEALRNSLQEKIGERLQESVNLHYRVLLQSGEIRSHLLNQLLDRGDTSPLSLSSDLFNDLRRELTIVPYRWTATLYLKSREMRQRLSQGWEGLVATVASFAGLIIFLTMPWIMWAGAHRISIKLNTLRVELVRQSRKSAWASKLAMSIQKIVPYFNWLVMLIAVYIAQYVLAMTVFAGLELLLDYVRYYVYYRLFRQLMQCDFIWVSRQIRVAKLWDLRRKVDVAARALGLSLFIIFSLLAAIESLIRKGLIYHLATRTMFDLGVLIAMVFAYQWRGIIGAGLTKFIRGSFGQHVSNLCNSRWGLIFSIPFFLLLVLLFFLRQFANWGSHFEFTKRITSEVFRYQLESAIDKESPSEIRQLPSDYLKNFVLSGIATSQQLKMPPMPCIGEIRTILTNWLNQTGSINSLAIVGHKGTGKTCLLQNLEQLFSTGQIKSTTVPSKLTSKQQVLEFFGEILNLPLLDNRDKLRTYDINCPKTIVLVDDAHNLFLAKQGGFEGYSTMLELISLPVNNIFWCLTFNFHAWSYLNSVYANNHYYDAMIGLTPWSEKAIQELILSMQAQTDFQISYDDIIQAAGSQGLNEQITYIENRFFSLLRQQSRGNPRLAVYLWLTSLRLVGEKALRVGLPEEPESSVLSDLPEDALFIFASIARHENLSLEQVVAVSQLDEKVVRYVLDKGVSLKLLDCNENRIYRLAVLYQYPLIHYLQAKHCLHE